MSKYLKLFETKGEFKTCLEAKIAGDNDVMGFPNVSVIGAEDSNGNFSASDVYYIKDLTKAEAIRDDLRPGRWVNPTSINIVSEGADVDALDISISNGLGGNGYPELLYVVRFQPYDWYDKENNITYYAFIHYDAYQNITSNTGTKDVLDGQDVGLNLLEGYDGYSPNPRVSDYDPNNPTPPYHGKIIYVKDISNPNDIYEREFTIDAQGNLTFSDNINTFDSDGYSTYAYHFTNNFYNVIDGYSNLNSGSGSGSGDGNQ